MRKYLLILITCFAFVQVFADDKPKAEIKKFAQTSANFTVEYATNLSQLDSWSDNSKFQWKEIDHGVIDNATEMEKLIEVVKDKTPKDTVGFYKQFFDARDNQYIVLRMDNAEGKRLFHVRVTNIRSTTDATQNGSRTYSTRDYIYISPPRGDQQIEIKVWPYGMGEEVAKTYTFQGHSYGARGARSVMLDRSRHVPGHYELQYVLVDEETTKTDTITISDLETDKLYTFYDYLLTPIKEAWLRFDGFKRVRLNPDQWAEDLVTHYDDGDVGVMTGSQMPFLKHKWLEAPNPTYLDSRLFAPHDTLWLNIFFEGNELTNKTNLVINTCQTDFDRNATSEEDMPWGMKDDRFYVVTEGNPCAIEAYIKGYAPKIIYYRGAYNQKTGWVYDDHECLNIYLDDTRMPDEDLLISKLDLNTLSYGDGMRDGYYLANIEEIDLQSKPITSVVVYDEWASRKDMDKYVDGEYIDRLANIYTVMTSKSTKSASDRIYLRKDVSAEENKIKKDAVEGDATRIYYTPFDYTYWHARFSLFDYLDQGDSGRPYIAVGDKPILKLPILQNLLFDIDEAQRQAEEQAKNMAQTDDEGSDNGKKFFEGLKMKDGQTFNMKFPLAPPPLYLRCGVNFDLVKSQKIKIYGALGIGMDFDFLDKKGATNKWKEGYNGIEKGGMGKFNIEKIEIQSTDANGITTKEKYGDIWKRMTTGEQEKFSIKAGVSLEALQQVAIPLNLRMTNWPGIEFLDELSLGGKAFFNFYVSGSLLDLGKFVTSKHSTAGKIVDYLAENKITRKIINAMSPALEFRLNTEVSAKAGIFYNGGEDTMNPLKTHVLSINAAAQADLAVRMGLKLDALIVGAEAGVQAVAGVYLKASAGNRLWFDRPFKGACWSYRAGFGFYYRVHALFWSYGDEKMFGSLSYQPAKLLGNKTNSNPFHKDFSQYMKTGTEKKSIIRRVPRRLPGASIASNVDICYPVRFLSGGDSIIYKSGSDNANDRLLHVASTGNPTIVSDYLKGGCANFHSASSPALDIVVFEQASRMLTDKELHPSDSELMNCMVNNDNLSDIYFAVKKAGTKWYSAKPIYTNDNNAGVKPRVALDDNGHAVAIWQEGYHRANPLLSPEEQNDITSLSLMGNLVLSRYDGEKWSKPIELLYLNFRRQLSDYQVTVKDGEVLVAGTEITLPDSIVKPFFIHVSPQDEIVLDENAPMQKNSMFELRRVGNQNVLAQLVEVDANTGRSQIALNSYDMTGKPDGALSTVVSPGTDQISKFHLVVDQDARSLRNMGVMWMQTEHDQSTDSIFNLLKAARLVPNGNNMNVGIPLILAQIDEGETVFDFDGYMTDEKINGCYLANDTITGSQLKRVSAYFSNAFSYSLVFVKDDNNAVYNSEGNSALNFLVKVNNLGTSNINKCVLAVEGMENPIPLHLTIPSGASAEERVVIPYQSGEVINTKLMVTYDDVLGIQKKQLKRYLERREKREFARRHQRKYRDEYSHEDVIFEQQAIGLYPDVPELECYPLAHSVDENGNNKFVVRVRNNSSRKMPKKYIVCIKVGEIANSMTIAEEETRGLVCSQTFEKALLPLLKHALHEQGIGFFHQRHRHEAEDIVITIPEVDKTQPLCMRAVVMTFNDEGQFVPITNGLNKHDYAMITVYPSNETSSIQNVYEDGDNNASLKISVFGNQVNVSGAKPGEDVRLYFANGLILGRQKASSEGKATFNMPGVTHGIYLLSNKNETVKFQY